MASCERERVGQVVGSTTFSPNSVIIDTTSWRNLVVSVDTANGIYTFSENPSLNVGDVMISEVGEGLIRRVTKIVEQSGKSVVTTEFASICDAVEQVSANFTTTLVEEFKSGQLSMAEGVTISDLSAKNFTNTALNLDINLVLYDKDGKLYTTSDQVRLSGFYGTTMDIEGDIKIRKFDLNMLMLKYTINQSTSLALTGNIPLTDVIVDKRLMRYKFPPQPWFPGFIVTPVFELYAGATLSTGSLTLELEKDKNTTTTIKYENEEWTTDKFIEENEKCLQFEIEGASQTKVYLKPKLIFLLNGVVAPKVEAELYNQLKASVSLEGIDWEIRRGFSMGIGVGVKIFKKELLDVQFNLFDINEILNKGIIIRGQIPSVNTIPVSSISSNSALFNGIVASDGNSDIIESGFYYSDINQTPDSEDIVIKSASVINGAFNANAVNLKINTKYWVRAWAKNKNGIGLGSVVSFITNKVETGEFYDYRGGLSRRYATVKIDNQVWMAENLAYFPSVGSWAYNDNDNYSSQYGRLYNWTTATTACPVGWHLPSDQEWEELAIFISNNNGGYGKQDDDWYYVGMNLKATSGWINDGNGTNVYQFSALPGGGRAVNGTFANAGTQGIWWSSTGYSNNTDAYVRLITNTSSSFIRHFYSKDAAFSVRCIRDY